MNSFNILFIVKEVKMEYLGIMYLISALKSHGHNVFLIRKDTMKDNDFFKKIEDISPQFICYSVCAGSEKYYFNLDALIQQKLPNLKYKSLYGGPAVTFNPEKFVGKNFIRGEGEKNIINFINNKPINDLQLVDINDIPDADRELVYNEPSIRLNPIKNMITRRGCRFNCAYCFNHKWNALHKGQCKNIIRLRSIENVINEALSLKEKWQPLKMIHIMDDGFVKPIEWLKEFAPIYKEKVNIPFICNVHPNDITEESADILAKAGCAVISLAIESASDENRKNILNRVGTKAQVKKAIQICNKYHIRTRLQNIIGLPVQDSLADAFETLDFNLECKPTTSWCAILQCYKGTKIYEKAKSDNYIPDDDSVDEGFFGISTLKIKNKKYIERLHKLWPLINAYPLLRLIAPLLIRIPLPFGVYVSIFNITKRKLSERDLWKVFK